MKCSQSITRDFLYDGDALVAEYEGSTLVRRYVHGAGVDEPLVWYNGAGLTDRRWLIADHQGTIVAHQDGAGAAQRYTYGPYGEPDAWGAQTTLSRFRYTGQAALPEIGLYHYKARVYDPVLGRFLQTDPVGYEGGDFNLYAYVANDPLNRADPTGLCDTVKNCLTGGTFDNGDGTVTVESSVILRAVVPGQVQWDAARTDWANGNEGEAVAHAGLMVAEQVATVATLGTSSLATQGARATTTGVEAAATQTAEGATRQGLMSSASPNAINAGLRAPPSAGAQAAAAARPTASGAAGEALPGRVNPTGSYVGVAEPLPPPQRGTSNPLADFLEALFGSSGGGP